MWPALTPPRPSTWNSRCGCARGRRWSRRRECDRIHRPTARACPRGTRAGRGLEESGDGTVDLGAVPDTCRCEGTVEIPSRWLISMKRTPASAKRRARRHCRPKVSVGDGRPRTRRARVALLSRKDPSPGAVRSACGRRVRGGGLPSTRGSAVAAKRSRFIDFTRSNCSRCVAAVMRGLERIAEFEFRAG